MYKLVFALAAALVLGACGRSQPADDMSAPAASSVAMASTTMVPDQPAQTVAPRSAEAMFSDKLDRVLAGSWRSPEHKARDQYRHPRQTLEFFGLKPDMTVIEITPGGGWYAEILAPLLKGSGTYEAAVFAARGGSGEASQQNAALRKKFASNPAQFSQARLISFDAKSPDFGAPDSADMVLTFRNAHNWTEAGNAQAMFKAFFDVLKPGGVLGVVDHRADTGADVGKTKDSGYLPQAYVVKLATDAGFRLDTKSEVNANPKDSHDHPKGVWTLPPTLRLGDKDKDKYTEIGESDRMTLRFVKPKADQIFEQGNDRMPASSTSMGSASSSGY